MSTTEINNSTSKQNHKMNEQQQEQSFLNHKHQRDLKGCSECLSSNEELLTFNKLKELMEYIFDNVLKPQIDSTKRKNFLTNAMWNKQVNISLCQECLLKNIISKGVLSFSSVSDKNESYNSCALSTFIEEACAKMKGNLDLIEKEVNVIEMITTNMNNKDKVNDNNNNCESNDKNINDNVNNCKAIISKSNEIISEIESKIKNDKIKKISVSNETHKQILDKIKDFDNIDDKVGSLKEESSGIKNKQKKINDEFVNINEIHNKGNTNVLDLNQNITKDKEAAILKEQLTPNNPDVITEKNIQEQIKNSFPDLSALNNTTQKTINQQQQQQPPLIQKKPPLSQPLPTMPKQQPPQKDLSIIQDVMPNLNHLPPNISQLSSLKQPPSQQQPPYLIPSTSITPGNPHPYFASILPNINDPQSLLQNIPPIPQFIFSSQIPLPRQQTPSLEPPIQTIPVSSCIIPASSAFPQGAPFLQPPQQQTIINETHNFPGLKPTTSQIYNPLTQGLPQNSTYPFNAGPKLPAFYDYGQFPPQQNDNTFNFKPPNISDGLFPQMSLNPAPGLIDLGNKPLPGPTQNQMSFFGMDYLNHMNNRMDTNNSNNKKVGKANEPNQGNSNNNN